MNSVKCVFLYLVAKLDINHNIAKFLFVKVSRVDYSKTYTGVIFQIMRSFLGIVRFNPYFCIDTIRGVI